MMSRSRWPALGLAICLASGGAILAYVLAGGRWAVAGAVIGALTGSFAPSVYEGLVGRGTRRGAWQRAIERPVPRSRARLLDPRLGLVEFVGREEELQELKSWCTDDRAGRLRLVTGPGGVGKTRLAVELCFRMRNAGWKAERVADGAEGTAIWALRAAHRGPALLVADYAESRAGLSQLVNSLAAERDHDTRVLLLARSAGEWWDRLGIEDLAAWDMVQVARQSVIEVSPVISADLSDAEIVARAVRSFARELRMPERTVEILGATGRKRVLDLHAAALVAILDETPAQIVKVNLWEVLGELLRHEQHFWYDSAKSLGLTDGPAGATQRHLRQVNAAACMLGAANEGEAQSLAARVPGLPPSAKIAEWLRDLYPPDPGEGDWIGTLQPDRLAELHAVRELSASPGLAARCRTNLGPHHALRATMLLARAASDYPEAEELLRQLLPAVADVIVNMPASADALAVIVGAIPYPTVILAPAAVALCQRILNVLSADADAAVRGHWLGLLGSWLSELGRPAEALAAVQQSVAIRRALAAAGAVRHCADLAATLSNLGNMLAEMGRPGEARPPAQEAVEIYRDLAAGSTDLYAAELARALANLGVRLSELGDPAAALTAEQEALAIRRELAAASGRYSADLAGSLANLGVTFTDLGQPAEALAVEREALAIRRDLAAVSPDQYRPELARSLANLGATFSELGRPAEGLPAAEEAVEIYRELAAYSGDRYRSDLARALANLGVRLSELGKFTDALEVEQEAVAIRRELAAANPGRHGAHLAASLANLGNRFAQLDRPAEALPPAQEAAGIYRDLAAASPGRYRYELAKSLSNLGATYSDLGRTAEGLRPSQEAVEIYRGLTAASPGRHRAHLAASLVNLGNRFSQLDRPTEALPPAQEAVGIYRDLTAVNPERYHPELAVALSNLGVTHAELGHPAAALDRAQEAVQIYRDLAAVNPGRHLPDLARSLGHLGGMLAGLDQPAEALPLAQESASIYRELATAEPEQYAEALARSLNRVAQITGWLDQAVAAESPHEEAERPDK